MVHALREARRVLKRNGLLIDLRPAIEHRRVGIARGGRWSEIGVMREHFKDNRAADRAVDQVVRMGDLVLVKCTFFDAPRVMDTLDEFREWLDEFVREGELVSHGWLVDRVAAALSRKRSRYKIIVHGPLMLQIMRRVDHR